MDPTAANVVDLLEQLDDEVDDLEEALAPILKAGLADTASKLPLLDKAKLYVLITYAVESMLFSYLRLHGVNAREHPVFVELTRVKQYFDKIKRAENPVDQKPGMVIDKSAAHRFVRAGLAGNDKLDFEREERLKKEKAKHNIKFADHDAPSPNKATPGAPKSTSPAEDSSDSSDDEDMEEPREVKEAPKALKKTEMVNKTATQKAKDRKVEVLASRSASQSKESTPESGARVSNAARKKKKQSKRKTHRKASEGK